MRVRQLLSITLNVSEAPRAEIIKQVKTNINPRCDREFCRDVLNKSDCRSRMIIPHKNVVHLKLNFTFWWPRPHSINDVMYVIIIRVPDCPQKVVRKPLIVTKFFFHLTCVALASLVGAHIEYANRATLRAFQARIFRTALSFGTPASKQLWMRYDSGSLPWFADAGILCRLLRVFVLSGLVLRFSPIGHIPRVW